MPTSTIFSKSKVKKLLSDFGAKPFKTVKGKDLWIKDEIVIIQIPGGNDSIDWEIFYEIAHEQLDVSDWDIDLWCGENGC